MANGIIIPIVIDKRKTPDQRINVYGSGRTPHVFRGNAVTFRVMVLDESGNVADLGDHTSLKLSYMPATRTEAAYAVKTVSIDDTTFTETEFAAGTKWHAEMSFTEGDMNPTLTALKGTYWMPCYGIATVGGGEITHGGGTLTIEEDGTGNTVESPPGPDAGITAEDATVLIDSAIAAQAILQDGSAAGTAIQEFLGLNLTDATELTIATGAVTATQGAHTIDTEADASSDDLDTITAAKGAGDILILHPANDARTVVLKHGTGNITTFNGADLTLDTAAHLAVLYYNGTNWLVLANSVSGVFTTQLLVDASRAGTGIQELLGLNLTDATELTIATGAVTATQGAHTIDTEADASSDDLDTITAAKGAGDILILHPANDARTVVLKHGTGNITTFDGADLTLDTAAHVAVLYYNGTNWLVISNSAGGSAFDPASPGAIGGTTPAAITGTAGSFASVNVTGGGNALVVTGNINCDAIAAYPHFSFGWPVSAGFTGSNAFQVGWSSGSDYSSVDTAIKWKAAGQLEINNGTAGTYRDLYLRSLIAAGGIKLAQLTVATLPTASSNTGHRYEVTDSNAGVVGSSVSDGGSELVEVRSDGSGWIITFIF